MALKATSKKKKRTRRINMKKVLFTTLGIISALAMFFGFPLGIVNIGRDPKMSIIYFCIGVAGLIGISVCALIMMFYKKKK